MKKFKNYKQMSLNDLLDGSNKIFKDNVIITNIIDYETAIKIEHKKIRNIKIRILKEKFKKVLERLEEIIEEYKYLKNRTEFWERKSTYDYDFEDWNTIKKVNGKLTRYYNELMDVYRRIEIEKEN